MDLVLVCVKGPHSGARVPVGQQVVIGRDTTCSLALSADSMASRSHARVFAANGQWFIADLGSTNGTLLNGQRLGGNPMPITPGMTVSIGNSELKVEAVQHNRPPVITPPAPASSPFVHTPSVRRPKGAALRDALGKYDQAMRQVIQDGVITPTEIWDLKRFQDRLGLTDQDTLDMRAHALAYITDVAIQNNRDDLMNANEHVKEKFGLVGISHPVVLSACNRAINFYGMQLIAAGGLPSVEPNAINLCQGEECHLELEAALLEERVVSSGWVSGHSGFSFRVAKGVRFHVGGTRGRHLSQKAVVPVSHGTLAITSERICFLGVPKSFDARWDQVMGIEPYSDGLSVFIANRTKAPTVQYVHPELAELAASICSCYIS